MGDFLRRSLGLGRLYVKGRRANPQNKRMRSTSKLLGITCVLLTVLLWAVTIMTDPAPGPIAAAGALTVIVALMAVFTSWG